jgi:hypothetical protein
MIEWNRMTPRVEAKTPGRTHVVATRAISEQSTSLGASVTSSHDQTQGDVADPTCRAIQARFFAHADRVIAPLAMLVLFGCGGAATSDATGTSSSDVTGTAIDVNVTDTGNVSVPLGPDSIAVAALLPSSDGTFSTIAGVVSIDGTFRIPNVPSGPYYLSYTLISPWAIPQYIVTSERQIDLGAVNLVRPDAVKAASAATQLIVTADGLAPWQDTDSIELLSVGAGMFVRMKSPDQGATGFRDQTVTLDEIPFPPRLIDGKKGDRATMTQLVTRTSGDLHYQSIGRTAVVPPFSLADGQQTAISASFTDVPPSRLSLPWKPSRLAQLAAEVEPSAALLTFELYITAEPGGLDRTTSSPTPPVLIMGAGPKTDGLLDLEYANPFPSEWGLFVSAESEFNFPSTYDLYGSHGAIGMYGHLDTPKGIELEPSMGPPRRIRIQGMDAFQDRSDVGESPTIEWDPPASGTPGSYLVRLLSESGSEYSAIQTKDTRVTFPPGVIEKGIRRYYLQVVALAHEDITRPRKMPAADSWASVDTSPFAP